MSEPESLPVPGPIARRRGWRGAAAKDPPGPPFKRASCGAGAAPSAHLAEGHSALRLVIHARCIHRCDQSAGARPPSCRLNGRALRTLRAARQERMRANRRALFRALPLCLNGQRETLRLSFLLRLSLLGRLGAVRPALPRWSRRLGGCRPPGRLLSLRRCVPLVPLLRASGVAVRLVLGVLRLLSLRARSGAGARDRRLSRCCVAASRSGLGGHRPRLRIGAVAALLRLVLGRLRSRA
jgi:hypothetical protein